MPVMTGGRFLAETLKGYGVTHAFFVPAIIRKAVVEMERVGIQRIVTHGEKAAYMADGYARASHRPGLCMAQSVGAANLAAGLQDPYLALSPIIAITGHRKLLDQYRNSYQEIQHMASDLDREQIKVWLVGLPDLDGEQLEPEPDYFEVEGMDGEQLGPKVDYFGIAALEREGREAEVEIAGWKPLCGPCAALNISPS